VGVAVRGEAKLGAVLLVALSVVLPEPVRAEDPGDAVPISVEVQVAFASNQREEGHIDPACADLQDRLPMRFSTLEMLTRERLKLTFGEVGRMRLPTGRQMDLVPISVVRNHLHVHFQMQGLVNTRLQMRSGVPVIVGGESHEGGQIIVMLTPRFSEYLKGRPRLAPRGPDLHRVNQPQ
jgi:hypothetical protein